MDGNLIAARPEFLAVPPNAAEAIRAAESQLAVLPE
jgi:hypothetical protein